MGGFYDGRVLLFSHNLKDEPKQIKPFPDKLPIVAIEIDKNENFSFFGNSIGNISIYKIDTESNKWKYLDIINAHMSAIADINCNVELNLWISASIDGYINLYTLPLCKLIRSIKTPIKKCSNVFLSDSPLPSIIVLSQEEKYTEIFVYSINGKLLLRQKQNSFIKCPIIMKDLNSNDYLAYILNETIFIRSCPNMFIQVSVENNKDIYAICPSEDMKILYGINKSGSKIYVIKDK